MLEPRSWTCNHREKDELKSRGWTKPKLKRLRKHHREHFFSWSWSLEPAHWPLFCALSFSIAIITRDFSFNGGAGDQTKGFGRARQHWPLNSKPSPSGTVTVCEAGEGGWASEWHTTAMTRSNFPSACTLCGTDRSRSIGAIFANSEIWNTTLLLKEVWFTRSQGLSPFFCVHSYNHS